MKKIILFLFILVSIKAMAQDQYAKDLPEYDAIVNDSTDVIYIDDSGVDKHLEMPTLLAAIHDSLSDFQDFMEAWMLDSISDLRTFAGSGTVGWSRVGNVLYPTDNGDSIAIGHDDPSMPFDVDGNARFRDRVYIGTNNLDYISAATNQWTFQPECLFDDKVIMKTVNTVDSKVLYFGNAEQVYIRKHANDLELTDLNAGTVTLTDLLTSGTGTIDTAGGQQGGHIAFFDTYVTLDGSDNYTFKSGTVKLTCSTGDTGMFISNGSTGNGLWVNSSSTGNGIYVANSSSGRGQYILNSSTGTGLRLEGTSSGSSQVIITTGTGNALYVGDGGGAEFTIDSAGHVYLNNFDTDATDTVPLILYKTNGKIDTATFYHADFGLKKVPLFVYYFTKRVNGEVNWPRYEGDRYHKISGDRFQPQLQAGIERAYVWIFRMQVFIAVLVLVMGWLVYQVIKLKKICAGR